jgi:hypothetical protein
MRLAPGPQPSPETLEALAQLSVDEIVRRLVPDTPELARVTPTATIYNAVDSD